LGDRKGFQPIQNLCNSSSFGSVSEQVAVEEGQPVNAGSPGKRLLKWSWCGKGYASEQ